VEPKFSVGISQSLTRRCWTVLVANLVLTVLLAGAFAPAAERYSRSFRLGGRTAAAAFFILPLYIGPALLWIRPPARWYLPGLIIGLLLAIPLALWTVLQNYPLSKPPIILFQGVFQGLVLSWIAYRRKWQ
jgi:hypothetical protein